MHTTTCRRCYVMITISVIFASVRSNIILKLRADSLKVTFTDHLILFMSEKCFCILEEYVKNPTCFYKILGFEAYYTPIPVKPLMYTSHFFIP